MCVIFPERIKKIGYGEVYSGQIFTKPVITKGRNFLSFEECLKIYRQMLHETLDVMGIQVEPLSILKKGLDLNSNSEEFSVFSTRIAECFSEKRIIHVEAWARNANHSGLATVLEVFFYP